MRPLILPPWCTRVDQIFSEMCRLWKHETIREKSCNKNQIDTLFILRLFRQSTSTCFGHICGSSSGGVLYIYNNRYVLCFSVDCLLAGRPAKRQSTEKPNTKPTQDDWRNQLRINGASSWFLLHRCIDMHGQQNIKYKRTNYIKFHPPFALALFIQ